MNVNGKMNQYILFLHSASIIASETHIIYLLPNNITKLSKVMMANKGGVHNICINS